jgi:hypothetical protein
MESEDSKNSIHLTCVEGWMGEYYEGGEERWEKIG